MVIGVFIMKTITVNNREFKIIKLLGKGKGGYSYLVDNDNKKFVVKQIHHEPCGYYKFGNKIENQIIVHPKQFSFENGIMKIPPYMIPCL